jgi:chaperonin GroES
MTKTLFLPEHVAQKIKADRGGAATALPTQPAEDSLDKAYVDAGDRVLDPSLLEKPLLDRLPQPTGWRVLVMPYQTAVQTKGGLFIPDEVRDRETVATVVAYVLKVGPLAYKDPNKFGPDPEPWCKQGDWVCIGRYAGSRFKIDGGEIRVINDDEVIATVLEPTDIKTV